MNCSACAHWELKGSPMRMHGRGTCAKEVGLFRKARTFGPAAPCNKNRAQEAELAVLAARTKALAKAGNT